MPGEGRSARHGFSGLISRNGAFSVRLRGADLTGQGPRYGALHSLCLPSSRPLPESGLEVILKAKEANMGNSDYPDPETIIKLTRGGMDKSDNLRRMAAEGVRPSILLRHATGVSVATIARTVGVSYPTAWKTVNLEPATGPRSRAVQEEVDRVLGIEYPWPKEA